MTAVSEGRTGRLFKDAGPGAEPAAKAMAASVARAGDKISAR